jgi:hypothetical protein
LFFFLSFAILLKWQSSIKNIYPKFWQYSKYESRKSQEPFHVCSSQLWKKFAIFFLKKKSELKNTNIPFAKTFFTK